MKKWKTLVALGCLGVAAGAVAEGTKSTLYIQVPSASLQDIAGPGGKSLQAIPGGSAVDWLGADKTKGWHRVKFGSTAGVLYQGVLGRAKPSGSLTVNAGSSSNLDAKALADSGAASKALSKGAVTYGKEVNHEDAVRQLLMAEGVENQTTFAKLSEHAKKASLPVPPLMILVHK